MALTQQYEPSVQPQLHTEEEYFALAAQATGRLEFQPLWHIRPDGSVVFQTDRQGRVIGHIRAMAGGHDDHNAIAANLVRQLGNILVPKGCRVYGSDMKIHTGDGMNTFPDAAVVCGPREYYLGRQDVITNPLVIVEVLSPSTEDYDRGRKFDHYQTIPSLADYLMVAQGEPRVWLYTRRPDGWHFEILTGLETSVTLPAVGVTLPLHEIYALIEFGGNGPQEEPHGAV